MYRAPYVVYPNGLYSDYAEFERIKFSVIRDAANVWADCDSSDASVYDDCGVRIPNDILWEIIGG